MSDEYIMNESNMEAAIIFETHLPNALQRALEYAGDDGYVASMPQLLHARVKAPLDNEIWDTWFFTSNSEESLIKTPQGNHVAAIVHGGGIFSTPARFRKLYLASTDRHSKDGFTGLFGGKILETEAHDMLEGRCPDGTEIPVFPFSDFRKGISDLPRRYAVVMDFETARTSACGLTSFDELKDDPLMIVRAGGLHQGAQLRMRQEAVERNMIRQAEFTALFLYPPTKGIVADDVKVKAASRAAQFFHGPQERRLVLHRVQTPDVDQAGRFRRIAVPRRKWRPAIERYTKGQPLRLDAKPASGPLHLRARCSDERCTGDRGTQPQPTPPVPAPSVADGGQVSEIASSHVKYQRAPQHLARKRTHDPGWRRPDRMEKVEGPMTMLRHNLRQHTRPAGGSANIMDLGAEKLVARRPWLLPQGEHMHVVLAREALDEPEQAWNNAVLATAVDSAGHQQADLHRPLNTVS